MKKLILLLSIFVFALSFNVSAQKQLKEFSDDTIKADTNYYASNVKVAKYSTQVVIFTFTKADVADSLNVAKIQGSVDNTTFYDLSDASANLTETTTDGTTRLYITNPLDLYYRGYLSCATGDTVAITNPAIIIKED